MASRSPPTTSSGLRDPDAHQPRFISGYYANVTEAVALGEHEVEFTFDQTGNPRTAHIMGDLPVCRGTGGGAKTRAANSATSRTRRSSRRSVPGPIELPISAPPRTSSGSGWRDYWGAELAVNIGRNNFDPPEITPISRTTTPASRHLRAAATTTFAAK